MAYNATLSHTVFRDTIRSFPTIFIGDDMKTCMVCSALFKPKAREITCPNRKCRLLGGIEKLSNGCWLYKKSSSGAYSKLRLNKKWYSAHRISYEVYNGEIPIGKWVCHHCDTPKCVNPAHLFLGTASENRRDAVVKKRIPLGERNLLSRLTYDQIKEMRSLYESGFSYERLSRVFNCSYMHVSNIIKKKYRKDE